MMKQLLVVVLLIIMMMLMRMFTLVIRMFRKYFDPAVLGGLGVCSQDTGQQSRL